MGHQPSNMQVIIQGTNSNGNVFLVDETGIIKSIKGASRHVSENPQVDGGARSALCETDSNTHQLHSALN